MLVGARLGCPEPATPKQVEVVATGSFNINRNSCSAAASQLANVVDYAPAAAVLTHAGRLLSLPRAT